MDKLTYVCDDTMAYVFVKNNSVSNVSPRFIEMTEFDKSDFIDKDLDDVFKLLRINLEVGNLWIKEVDRTYFLFSKSLNIFEVEICVNELALPEEKVIFFKITPKSQIDDRFPCIYQLYKDDLFCISLFSVPDFTLLRASQKYIDFFDEPFNVKENSIGKSIYEILPHFRGSNIEAISIDVIHSGKSAEFKEQVFSNFKSGVTYWDCVFIPIFQNDKVKFLSIIAIEVTDRVLERHKKIEFEVNLIKSRTKHLEAQHLAKIGNWEWNLVTKEIYWSDEMYQIFGIDKSSVVGRLGDAILKVIHPEDLSVFEVGNNPFIVEKKPFEYRIISPDGSTRYIRAKTGDVKYDVSGKPSYLIGIVQDITEQRTTQLAQLYAEEEKQKFLQREIELKDEFLAIISHEFKTPITVINSATQALELICKNELSEKAVGFLSKIKQNANRQLKLVNNLLEVASMKAGHININKMNIDIVQLTKSILESIKVFAEQKGIDLTFSSTMQRNMIGIDEEKYERILLNILSNAIKYTHKGNAVSVKLSRKTIKRKQMICLEIKDEGVGIPSDKRDMIFERFGRANSSLSRQTEGTGIGLYIVKKFVELLDGEITLESEEGAGSTFTILLPNIKIKEVKIQQTLNVLNDNRIIQAASIEFSDVYMQ